MPGDLKEKKSSARGGYRPNAGRKSVHGETKVIRVPVAYIDLINALIQHLDSCRSHTVSAKPFSSKAESMSLDGKLQSTTFKTKTTKD